MGAACVDLLCTESMEPRTRDSIDKSAPAHRPLGDAACVPPGSRGECRHERTLVHRVADAHGTGFVWYACEHHGCGAAFKRSDRLKQHMRNLHGVDVRWHHCDQAGCHFKCKSGSGVTRHKAHVHGIGTRWHACPHPGCAYVTKQRAHLPVHRKRHHPVVAPVVGA